MSIVTSTNEFEQMIGYEFWINVRPKMYSSVTRPFTQPVIKEGDPACFKMILVCVLT